MKDSDELPPHHDEEQDDAVIGRALKEVDLGVRRFALHWGHGLGDPEVAGEKRS